MAVRGTLERKDSQAIQGWILCEEAASAAQELEILIDGQVFATVKADLSRPDVAAAGFGTGACGFYFRMPPDLGMQEAASAEIRLLGTELYLTLPRAAAERKAPEAAPGAGSVLILGPARTGTSVTLLLMKEVFGLSGLGEGHVLPAFQRLMFSYYEHARVFAGQHDVLAGYLSVEALERHLIPFVRRFYFDRFGGEPFVDKTPGLEALVGAPFVRKVFPGARIIVTTRNGVEVVESYRRKFGADFEAACREWAQCAAQIETLKAEMPDIFCLDQNEMRAAPEAVAARLAAWLEQPEKAEDAAAFLRRTRADVRSRADAWDAPLTLDTVDWTHDEKLLYRKHLRNLCLPTSCMA